MTMPLCTVRSIMIWFDKDGIEEFQAHSLMTDFTDALVPEFVNPHGYHPKSSVKPTRRLKWDV